MVNPTRSGDGFPQGHQWADALPDRVTFISDLHLFTRRCTAGFHAAAIDRAADESEVVVWGGDLFDLKWHGFDSLGAAVDASIRWLDAFHDRHAATGRRFVYLRGNHDCHPALDAAVQEWAAARDDVLGPLDWIAIGDVVATHGDVIEGGGGEDGWRRYRRAWRDHDRPGAWRHPIYDAAVAARLHRAAAMTYHRRGTTLRRLDRWVDTLPGGGAIRRVVFGHTHRRLIEHRRGGRTYDNPGAAVRHVRFTPVVVVPAAGGSASA